MLWRDGIKALFDPCPAGWRVPRGGKERLSPWYNFGVGATGNMGTGIPNATWTTFQTSPESGYRFYRYGTSGATAWYPCASFREPDGKIKYTGQSSLLWTTTRMNENRMHDLYFYANGVRVWGGDANTYGNSVRCVRE